MRKLLLCFSILLLYLNLSFGQNSFTAILTDNDTKEALVGATALLENTNKGAITDSDGKLTITGIPDGKHTIIFSYIGYSKSLES